MTPNTKQFWIFKTNKKMVVILYIKYLKNKHTQTLLKYSHFYKIIKTNLIHKIISKKLFFFINI